MSTPTAAGIERVAGNVTEPEPATAVGAPAPEHVVEAFGVAAITTPLGKVSVNAAVRLAAEVLALLSVTVSVEVAFAAMVLGANALATVGVTVVTVKLAVAAAALLPLEVCSALAAIVLVYTPPIAEVTSTLTVQLPAGIERVVGSVTEPEPATAVGPPAPAHVVEAFGVAAITTPLGKVSVNAAVRLAALALALLSVMVSVETALAAMVFGAKAFATVGATVLTARVALAAAALLPLEVCSALAAIVLTNAPPEGDTTSTVTVHEPGVAPTAAGIERVAGSVTEPVPATAVTAPAPEQVVAALGVGATTTGTGNVSVNAAVRLATLVLALVSVIVSVEGVPAFTGVGRNALAMVGAVVLTVRFAVAAAALLPLEVCSALAAIVLVYTPPTAEVTSTLTVQLPVGIERVAGNVMVPVPAAATTAPAPAHVVEAFGVAATTTPAGSVSVNAAVRLAAEVFALLSVMVNVDTPLAAIVLGANALAIVGVTVVTVRFAVAATALLPLEVCSALAAIVLA